MASAGSYASEVAGPCDAGASVRDSPGDAERTGHPPARFQGKRTQPRCEALGNEQQAAAHLLRDQVDGEDEQRAEAERHAERQKEDDGERLGRDVRERVRDRFLRGGAAGVGDLRSTVRQTNCVQAALVRALLARHTVTVSTASAERGELAHLQVVVEDPPFRDGRHEAGKIIVEQDYVGGLARDLAALRVAHGDPDVGLAQRRRVVDAVARHGDDLAAALEVADDLELLLRCCARKDELLLRHDLVPLLLGLQVGDHAARDDKRPDVFVRKWDLVFFHAVFGSNLAARRERDDAALARDRLGRQRVVTCIASADVRHCGDKQPDPEALHRQH